MPAENLAQKLAKVNWDKVVPKIEFSDCIVLEYWKVCKTQEYTLPIIILE